MPVTYDNPTDSSLNYVPLWECIEHPPQIVARLWADIFETEAVDLYRVQPFFELIGWRVVRELARIAGLLPQTEPLTSLPINAWIEPLAPAPADAWNRQIPAFEEVEAIKHFILEHELALLPSPDTVTPYTNLIAKLETLLALSGASKAGTQAPSKAQARTHILPAHALLYLLNPLSLLQSFPDRETLIAYDLRMIEEGYQQLSSRSRTGASTALRNAYGLLPHECSTLFRRSAALAASLAPQTREEAMVIELARLDEFADRARQFDRYREEIEAIKQRHALMGLNKPDPEATESVDTLDLRTVMEEIAAEDPKQLPGE